MAVVPWIAVLTVAGLAAGDPAPRAPREGGSCPLSAVFRAADLDGDGRVSRREADRAMLPRGAFAEADADRDGYLVDGEFRALYRRLREEGAPDPTRRVEGELARQQALRRARRDSGPPPAHGGIASGPGAVLARLASSGVLEPGEARTLGRALEPAFGGAAADARDLALLAAWARDLIARERARGHLSTSEAAALDALVLARARELVAVVRAEGSSAADRSGPGERRPTGPSALRRRSASPRD